MSRLQSCRCPNYSLFLTAVFLWIGFLCVELFIRTYNLYSDVPAVDIPSHFFSGIALFAIALWYFSLTGTSRKPILSLSFVLAAAIVWEILEKLQEFVVFNPPGLIDVFFWDGVKDILVTVVGALAGFMLLLYLRKKSRVEF